MRVYTGRKGYLSIGMLIFKYISLDDNRRRSMNHVGRERSTNCADIMFEEIQNGSYVVGLYKTLSKKYPDI